MSHNIINKVSIKKKTLEIVLDDKINKISNSKLIDLFCIIHALNILEIKKGNEYEKAWLKIKYIEDMIVTEYINIFNIIRIPTLYEFIKYFLTIEKKINQQNTETKLNLNEYLNKSENVSQKIIIIMIFDIETTIEELNTKQNILLELLKINKINEEIFNIIKNDS